jgi:hypothetical protein
VVLVWISIVTVYDTSQHRNDTLHVYTMNNHYEVGGCFCYFGCCIAIDTEDDLMATLDSAAWFWVLFWWLVGSDAHFLVEERFAVFIIVVVVAYGVF